MKNLIEYSNGIHLVGTDLWLDARDPQDMCFISHAHVDHLGSHTTIIASKPTVRFYEQRMRTTNAIVLEYGKPKTVKGMALEILPAGHILGSAQLLITFKRKKILYSGDIKLKPSDTVENIRFKQADILVMEATYGHPKFLFPDREVIINQLCAKIDETLHVGFVPVIAAYSLGKGQEIAKILGDKGYQLILHNTIFDLMKLYEQFGISFQRCEKYVSHAHIDGKVLVMPPYVIQSKMIQHITRRRVFLLSGWSLNHRKISYPVDEILPLSDHADFNDLLMYVRTVNPHMVYVTHGNPDFVMYLEQIGYKAQYLGSAFNNWKGEP